MLSLSPPIRHTVAQKIIVDAPGSRGFMENHSVPPPILIFKD
jgi:hypothetical protein